MTRIVGYNLLKTAFVLYVGTILLTGCGSPAESKSSEANISELTLAIGDTEYSVDFADGNTAMIELPSSGNTQETVRVASVTLSAGATGVAQGDTLQVSNNDPISITVTAEDGTTTKSYTISVTLLDVDEIPKEATSDIRDSYVLFSISASQSLSAYHLAVKKTEEDPPSAAEMTAGALKRNLGTNAINVLIAQRLDAPIVTFAKDFFDGNTSDVPTGMTATKSGTTTHALVYDATYDTETSTWTAASDENEWVAQSVLEPNSQYVLYGMADSGTEVLKLKTFMTDASATHPADTNIGFLIDTTLAKGHIELSLNAHEYYILPFQTNSRFPEDFQFCEYFYSGGVTGPTGGITGALLIDHASPSSYSGGTNSEYKYQLLLFRSEASTEAILSRSAYVLMDTSRMGLKNINESHPIHFGKRITYAGFNTSARLDTSVLKIQQ